MALITCLECNKQISEYADSCPHCGCPMNKIKEKFEKINSNLPENIKCPACGVIRNISELRLNYYKCRVCGTDVRLSLEDIRTKYHTNDSNQRHHSLNIPKCPTCNSENIHKISSTEKAINVGLFGIFGNKRKKQFHCKNCGYEW